MTLAVSRGSPTRRWRSSFMSDRALSRSAWIVYLAFLGITGLGVFFFLLNGSAVLDLVTLLLAFVSNGTVGLMVASRRPRNAIGWILLGLVTLIAAANLGQQYGEYGLLTRPGSLPAARWIVAIGTWSWPAGLFLGIFLFLLFPDGRPASPRWNLLLKLGALGYVLANASFVLTPGELDARPVILRNPLGVEGPGHVIVNIFGLIGFPLIIATFIGGIVSLILRYRRSQGVERQQLKWFAFAGAIVGAVFLLTGLWDLIIPEWVARVTDALPFLVVPVAIGVAILKYRLYDIDLVINKTLVYGSLAGFITAVYVGVVVGIGTLFGRGDEPNLGLSILATAVVAVAFQPVRERVQHLANRLVYGKRATPYEVLSEFSHRMASTYAAEEILPRMARILAEGTGAAQARVWLRVAGELTPAASWPEDAGNGQAPDPHQADLLVEVTHQGEDLGALSISKAPGDRLSPAEDKLARDLASQAGLVLRNVRLIEDLKASRVRLVQAQDQERRRIERNIHDGAQQQLVALNVKLGLTRAIAPKDPVKAEQLLAQLQEETNQALSDLRDLARGIYPPLLADQGLKAALEAQARKSPLTVTVEGDSIGRYPQEVEAAVYFCVLEALQNVAKYAGAAKATVRLFVGDGDLGFKVSDDGTGFDPDKTPRGSGLTNMADRLAALGGGLDVESAPGVGTAVHGRLPMRALKPVG
jgi:signal transduction histidine kinase